MSGHVMGSRLALVQLATAATAVRGSSTRQSTDAPGATDASLWLLFSLPSSSEQQE